MNKNVWTWGNKKAEKVVVKLSDLDYWVRRDGMGAVCPNRVDGWVGMRSQVRHQPTAFQYY